MRVRRLETGWSLLFVALGAAACGERHAILSPPEDAAGANVTIAARPPGPSLDEIAWTGEFVIDGAPVAVTITITNTGKNLSNVYVAQRVEQGGSVRELGSTPVTCPNATPGLLVAGATCVTQLSSAVQSTGGTGTIGGGTADLVTVLGQASGKKGKVLASSAEVITLATPAPPSIESVIVDTEFDLEGAAVPYTITLANPDQALGLVIVQARMVQGDADRAAGGTEVQCDGEASGHLPVGGCTFDYTAFASNLAGGGGVLLPGEATLVLDLYHGETLVDTWSTTVTLVRELPFIVSVSWFGMPDLMLGFGTAATLNYTLYNPLPYAFEPVNIVLWVKQGTAMRSPGTENIHCGGLNTIDPGFCQLGGSISVHNGLPAGDGVGDLVDGPAVLEVTLRNTNGNPLHVVSIPIVLTN